MKKWIFLLVLMLCSTGAWADLPDRVSHREFSGNTLVKSSPGDVFSIQVTYIGVTAGDYIRLIDSSTSSGTVRYSCVASTTSGVCRDDLTVASYFGTAILYTEQKSGGTFRTYIQYF